MSGIFSFKTFALVLFAVLLAVIASNISVALAPMAAESMDSLNSPALNKASKEEPRTADAPAPHAGSKHEKEFNALGTSTWAQWSNCRNNPKNGWTFTRDLGPESGLPPRIARICNINEGNWTVDISEQDGTSVTTFWLKDARLLKDVVKYLYESSYYLPEGLIITEAMLNILQ